MNSRSIPLYTVPEEPASRRIDDNARLMQGVHPTPKDIPRSIEPSKLFFLVSIFKCFSDISRRNFKIPAVCMPNIIISSPPIFPMIGLYCESNPPITLAVAPNVVKITLNPNMNPKDLIINNFLDVSILLSLKLASVRLATYAGSSGKTQGEKKDSSPAIKAKITETLCNITTSKVIFVLIILAYHVGV